MAEFEVIADLQSAERACEQLAAGDGPGLRPEGFRSAGSMLGAGLYRTWQQSR